MKIILKILGFITLIGLYYYFAGAPAWRTNYGIKLAVIYQAGAVIAFWIGGKRIGTLEPVSLRPIFIALGVIMMLAMFILMFQTRGTARQLLEIHGRAPDISLEPTAGSVFSSAARATSRVGGERNRLRNLGDGRRIAVVLQTI